MCIYKLLSVIDSNLLFSNFFFITFILYPILSILTLLAHQALLTSLLGIIGNINSYNIVLNLTQLFSISTGIREYLSNIIVKDIKGILLFRPRLLKLQVNNRKLSKDRKIYFNITTTLAIHILIIRIKGIRFYIVSLIIYLQDLLIGFLILKGCTSKIIQARPVPVINQQRLGFYIQQQGQDILKNRLKKAVNRRSKRHNKKIIKIKKILMEYQVKV